MEFNFAKKPSKFKRIISKLTDLFKNGKLIWIAIGIGVLIIFVIGFFVILHQLTTPLDTDNGEKIFTIEQGQSLEKIAENLKKQGLINSKSIFVFHVWSKNKTENLQAGQYSLSPSMTIPEIAKKIVNGEVIEDWVKITIPEGWTNKQIEERLLDSEMITENEKFSKKLEGYLFPDTYYFEKDSTVEEIVEKMQDNFDKKVTEDLKTEIKRQNKNLYDILIMASILEREVKSDEDRAIVSGIFWKRLESNYPLESCATIAYILEIDKWRYSVEETRIESPYNTYLNVGLPPTPINNPGLSAIEAAVYPEYTDYNFFLTDPETGVTIFSKTFDEHNANKRKYF